MNEFVIKYKLCHIYFAPNGWNKDTESKLHNKTKTFDEINQALYKYRSLTKEEQSLIIVPSNYYFEEFLERIN